MKAVRGGTVAEAASGQAGATGPIRVATARHGEIMALSIFVWVLIGMAAWHFSVLVPDRFWGGIIGAFGAAVAGALLSGYLLPGPGIPVSNPPGTGAAVWAMPGSVIALLVSYLYGARRDRSRGIVRD
jgi:hypothetical protein